MTVRFDSSFRTFVPQILSSSSLDLFSNNLLPPVKTPNFRVSSSHAFWISRCSSSLSLDTQENIKLSFKKKKKKKINCSALDSVVKIFSFCSEPNRVKPWQMDEEKKYTGSGFVIAGEKTLTNAHVVENHSYVQVRKHGSLSRYKAKVKLICHECDLAILVIDSKEFWEDLNPLELGGIPFVNETVSVLGYPDGGDTISVTKGIVSRVEPIEYGQGSTELLAIQIDAAINDGNSGGPVLIGNKVVGVAFGSLSYSENIGYIIPTPVIKHFLSGGVENSGQHIGFGSLDISFQPLWDVQIRKHFKMRPGMTGVLLNETTPLSGAHGILKKDDIVLAVDGVPIENDGKVHFRKKERISFNHSISMKKPGETVLLDVLREGQQHTFNIILKPVQLLVPKRQLDPSYYIFAGFVFVPLSMSYKSDNNCYLRCSPKKQSQLSRNKRNAYKPGEQIVIISKVLLNDINAGYTDFEDLQVEKVNGAKVLNLKHLYELVETCCTEDLRLDLEDERVVILHYKSAKEANSLILERHGIPSTMSKDLQK